MPSQLFKHADTSAQRADVNAHTLRVLLVLSALMSFASVSTDLYLPALPALATQFHTNPGRVELTISSFLIGFSLGQLLWGPLSDRYGRRLPIVIGLLLFVLGSLGCAESQTVWQMVNWRIVQALGACAGPVIARAKVRDLYAKEQSAKMLSTLISIMAIAPLLGPILGGQILRFWSWHVIFWSLAAVGLVMIMALQALPESLAPQRRSQVSLTAMFSGYLSLLRSRRLLKYAIAGGFFYGGAYAFIAGTPFSYISYYQVPAQLYGLLFGVNILGIMAANYLNTLLLKHVSSDRLFRIGTAIAAVTALGVAINTYFGWGGLWRIAIPVFFFMAMNGLIVANSVASALNDFPQQAGSASALLGAMHYGSGILSAALVGWFDDGTPWTMGWIIGACGVGCWLAARSPTALKTEPAV
ncbi:Bcr/CflA family multidrug efflux MFS transporter [Pseudomonas kermanshahensis]|uniref:Bcr/CflA family efflux transporter n=1 Tax=Pseudomonas kermanshahensis TaxID=2745482 RepID=A0ABU8R0F7_9PSED